MVIYRHRVTRGILTCLGLEGHRFHRGTYVTLVKFWLLVEMQITAMREAFLRDDKVSTDMDIVFFHLFLLKLDMRLSDPILGNGMCELSHMLLTQKSLSLLYKVLTKKVVLDYDEATDMLVRTYLSGDLDTDTDTWLEDEIENGIPEEEWVSCSHDPLLTGERSSPPRLRVLVTG